MSKYINIVILYHSNFHKGSKNSLHIDTLRIYKTSEKRLPRFKGHGQGQTKVKKVHNSKCIVYYHYNSVCISEGYS